MKIQRIILVLFIFALVISFGKIPCGAEVNQKVTDFLNSVGLKDWLDTPVKISRERTGIISITDKGSFLKQYIINNLNRTAEPNLIIGTDVRIPSTCDKVVIVTHGWVEKAEDKLSEDIAIAINFKIDHNEWVCGYFDWRSGASALSPVEAAQYAKDSAGPRLAAALLRLGRFKHIHLIGFSAGCWAIDSAAKIIEKETDARIHLTFLDAYVPMDWSESRLGDLKGSNAHWIEQYYARDITLKVTQVDLTGAHNVDITKIDPGISGHKFPLFWYLATINGRYREDGIRRWGKLFDEHKRLTYGFSRSLETGEANWDKSLTLQRGNKAVKLKKPRKKWFH